MQMFSCTVTSSSLNLLVLQFVVMAAPRRPHGNTKSDQDKSDPGFVRPAPSTIRSEKDTKAGIHRDKRT